ncbi:hypothetical protein [Brevundimonas naejangsanensis]|uniref:hypothetical protein n=1 Tax=Brevundimonas naejangsanensis TaxID=588932 RepID=UPI00106A5054|nr:hypothetical protein [Brevundimonas naejangsanensis]QBQ49522.1 hypothetical protein E3U41_12975 [Brevundimonas naejangsanensis]
MTKNNDVAKAIPNAISLEIEALTPEQGETLMSIWPMIYRGVEQGYALVDENRRRQIILTGSVDDMCVSGITTCGNDTDEAIRVARMNFEAARDLLSLAKASNPQPEQWAATGASCGHAELRAQLILSGLYGVLEEGQANSESAQQVQAARETGGAKRGEQMTAMADEWKAKIFPYATELDRKNPKWTRDKLATDILFQFEGEVPGYKAVTDWLAAEVEQPNGPIRSRARKKSA